MNSTCHHKTDNQLMQTHDLLHIYTYSNFLPLSMSVVVCVGGWVGGLSGGGGARARNRQISSMHRASFITLLTACPIIIFLFFFL